jgi:hypothetical protein
VKTWLGRITSWNFCPLFCSLCIFLNNFLLIIFSWDKYTFSESLGYKLVKNYDEFKNSSLFFQRIIKRSEQVQHPTCLETNFILIPNFPQISIQHFVAQEMELIFLRGNNHIFLWEFFFVLRLSDCRKWDFF